MCTACSHHLELVQYGIWYPKHISIAFIKLSLSTLQLGMKIMNLTSHIWYVN